VYDYLRGTLIQRRLAKVVVDVGGLGFELFTPLSTHDQLPPAGTSVQLLVHYHQREDGPRLYGFMSAGERELFRTLIGISGIGPATAIQILSAVQIERFYESVEAGDEKALMRIKGIGKKTAQRLIVELAGKLPPLDPPAPRDGAASPVAATPDRIALDARRALETLGVDGARAEKAVAQAKVELGRDPASADELLRVALRFA